MGDTPSIDVAPVKYDHIRAVLKAITEFRKVVHNGRCPPDRTKPLSTRNPFSLCEMLERVWYVNFGDDRCPLVFSQVYPWPLLLNTAIACVYSKASVSAAEIELELLAIAALDPLSVAVRQAEIQQTNDRS